MSILHTILEQKQREVASLQKSMFENLEPSHKNFRKALESSSPNDVPSLIAEIKKASPSKGDLAPEANVESIARIYESSGAAAISVLTDQRFFSGSLDDLKKVSDATTLPVLRKDFITSPLQIMQARAHGADAVLLMVSIIQDAQNLKLLLDCAREFGMDALVETHTAVEIEIALAAGAKIIGVNARNFSDLSVDLDRLPPLLQLIPDDIVKVAESGIHTLSDIKNFQHDIDAMLVGSSLMAGGEGQIAHNIHHFFTASS